MDRPNSFPMHVVRSESMPDVKLLVPAFLILLIVQWRRRSRWDLYVLLVTLLWLTVISYGVLMFNRYSLPIVVMTYALAGMGAIFLVRYAARWGWRGQAVAWTACLALIIGVQLPRSLNYLRQFAIENDSRQRVRRWIQTNVPRDARIVADFYSSLEGRMAATEDVDLPQRVRVMRDTASAAGTFQEVCESYDYVVVCDANYERFMLPQVKGVEDIQLDLDERRAFYTELFSKGELVWSNSSEPMMHAFTNPEIRVYRVNQKTRR